MFTSIKSSTILFAVLTVIGTLGNVANAESHMNPGYFDGNDNFVDGAITWQKPNEVLYTYDEAEGWCNQLNKLNPDANGAQWQLPTAQQFTVFWRKTIAPYAQKRASDFNWKFGNTWVLDDENKKGVHRIVVLPNRLVPEISTADMNYAICVKYPTVDTRGNYSDGTLVWSRVENKTPNDLLTYADAEKHCKTYPGKWTIPTKDQLLGFFNTVVEPGVLDHQEWGLINSMWSSTEGKNGPATHYTVRRSRHSGPPPFIFDEETTSTNKAANVTCVRPLFAELRPAMAPLDRVLKEVVLKGENYGFNNLTSITMDKEGNIWVVSRSGNVTKISSRTSMPTVYKLNELVARNDLNLVGVTADKQGDIWVLNDSGVLRIKYGQSSSVKPWYRRYDLANPPGITTDPQGNIWIANSRSSHLSNLNGSVLKISPNKETEPVLYIDPRYPFDEPTGITMDKKGHIWITDGWYIAKISTENPHEFVDYYINAPGVNSIAVDDVRNTVWVTNGGDNTVTRIPMDKQQGRGKVFSAGFSKPVAVAVDSQGNAFVVNNGNSSVTEIPFSSPESPVVYTGSKYEFVQPTAIAIDSQDRIWVTNSGGPNGTGNSITGFSRR